MRKDNMKNSLPRMALTAALGLLAVLALAPVRPVFSQAAAGGKQTPSKAAAKTLKAAEEDIKAKKYDAAAVELKKVEALPEKTAYDEYLVNEMQGYLDTRAKNYPGAAKDLEASLNSGFLKPSDVPGRVRELANINLAIKDYNKAIDLGNRAIKGGFADDATYQVMEQAYYLKGDQRATLKFVNDYVDQQVKAGKTPKENSLKTIMSACIALKDQNCEQHAFERLVLYYPKGDYWGNLIVSLFSSDDYKEDVPRLQLLRLAFDVNVLKNPPDFTEMAQLDLDQNNAGEAVRVLQKALDSNVFTEQREKDKNGRLLAAAQKRATADQTNLAQMTTQAGSAPNGQADVALGLTLMGYQQYPQAVTALQQGIQKGGLQAPLNAQLLLGIAQLKAGSKDDALKTFHGIKGDPKFEHLATLWALHARQA
jgi:hypothetical protein